MECESGVVSRAAQAPGSFVSCAGGKSQDDGRYDGEAGRKGKLIQIYKSRGTDWWRGILLLHKFMKMIVCFFVFYKVCVVKNFDMVFNSFFRKNVYDCFDYRTFFFGQASEFFVKSAAIGRIFDTFEKFA